MIYQDKIYGTHRIEGVLEALVQTATFQRLRKIHQGGAVYLVDPWMNQTRYEHSIGVMLLIRQLGGSLEEQIAGLLHDISHTAFSHVIDYVLQNEQEDYHEERYPQVLRSEELVDILHQHGYEVEQFLDIEQFSLLEHPLPGLCADRIDYTLRDLYQYQEISLDDIQWFLEGLLVMDGLIVLRSKAHGAWFQSRYHLLVKNYFTGERYQAIHETVTALFRQYMDTNILTLADFHEDDVHVLQQVVQHLGEELGSVLKKNLKAKLPRTKIQQKQRSVNPLIHVDGKYCPLSEL